MKANGSFSKNVITWAAGIAILFPLVAYPEDFWGFTGSRMSNPSTAGIYWNHTTNASGDLEVDAAVVDHNGNVVETATFGDDGELLQGVTTNGSESLGDYIDRTEGGSGDTASGMWGESDPYNCDFTCDPNGGFTTPDDPFGGF